MNPAPSTFRAVATEFAGLFVLQPRLFEDKRGCFVKTFHSGCFQDMGIPFEPREDFYSISGQDVLRGMHCQVPPAAHSKLVYCLSGRVLDVVVDLRRRSPQFGKAFSHQLDADRCELLFIPPGFAHGFLALEERSIMGYMTDVPHVPECDTGIAWNSFGFAWPVTAPILSERDQRLPGLPDFATPF